MTYYYYLLCNVEHVMSNTYLCRTCYVRYIFMSNICYAVIRSMNLCAVSSKLPFTHSLKDMFFLNTQAKHNPPHLSAVFEPDSCLEEVHGTVHICSRIETSSDWFL